MYTDPRSAKQRKYQQLLKLIYLTTCDICWQFLNYIVKKYLQILFMKEEQI